MQIDQQASTRTQGEPFLVSPCAAYTWCSHRGERQSDASLQQPAWLGPKRAPSAALAAAAVGHAPETERCPRADQGRTARAVQQQRREQPHREKQWVGVRLSLSSVKFRRGLASRDPAETGQSRTVGVARGDNSIKTSACVTPDACPCLWMQSSKRLLYMTVFKKTLNRRRELQIIERKTLWPHREHGEL